MVAVVDATPDRWDDVVEVMGRKGDPARCWCQFFRLVNADARGKTVEDFRTMLHEQIDAARPPGVLGYDDSGTPVGWCGVAPRSSYPRLATAVVSKATTDEDGLWSVVCFVVRVGHRRQGVARALLEGALDLARRHGARTVEAYPVSGEPGSAGLYPGPLALYEGAGFTVVAEPSASRSVVRMAL